MIPERRRYSRFLVHPDEAEILVQIGESVLPARLTDQSSSGMQVVLAPTGSEVPAGAVIWVRTSAGCTEARVVRASQEEKDLHLGLERLKDVPTLSSFQSQPWWTRLPTFVNWDARLTGVGLALVLCVCLAIFGVFFVFTDAGASALRGSGGPGAAATEKGKSTFLNSADEATLRAQSQHLQDLFKGFTPTQVTRDLGLTPQQEGELRTLLETARLLRTADAFAENELARLGRAHQRLVSALSPSQLARWKATVEAELDRMQAGGESTAESQDLFNKLFPARMGANAGGSGKSR